MYLTNKVRDVNRVLFSIQAKNTPASGSLQKVLITVSVRKLTVQDMISKVFDQPAEGASDLSLVIR